MKEKLNGIITALAVMAWVLFAGNIILAAKYHALEEQMARYLAASYTVATEARW